MRPLRLSGIASIAAVALGAAGCGGAAPARPAGAALAGGGAKAGVSSALSTGPSAPSSAASPPALLSRPGPLTDPALAAALSANGVTVVSHGTPQPGLLDLRISLTTPTVPPAWPGAAAAAKSTTTASGWIVWPDGSTPSGLVLFGHGCCGAPPDLDQQASAIAVPTHAVVIAMDYRNAAAYAPDLASEDSAAALTVIKKAVTSIEGTTGQTVAYGFSEGGGATALMIEHHPGLVDDWVDQSGLVDLPTTAALWQKEIADKASESAEINLTVTQSLLDKYQAAVGTPPRTDLVTDLSPIKHAALLSGLHRAFLIHATGDAVVPYANTDEMAKALVSAGVPTYVRRLVPAAGQPDQSSGYHMTQAAHDDAMLAITVCLTGNPAPTPGLTTTHESIVIHAAP